MSYCPNPTCEYPQNPRQAKRCQHCGSSLQLSDRYRLLRLISEGGFGTTFLAVDETSPRKLRCVVKQFSLQRQNRQYADKAIKLFEDEADRLADLGDHPQIPQLLDHFIDAGGQYLVQEFIDGKNLETSLQDDGTFTELEIRELLADLLPVLHFVHQRQVIHRDIKPANLILPYADERLVLVDFGASKYATGTALARTGTVIGSAGYAAPEQTLGKATFASDLYSLGVTCVHLLTGLHPFELYSVNEDRWIWRESLSRPVSDRLADILNRLLERALSIRYPTARDVWQDLIGQPIPRFRRQLSSDRASSPGSSTALATMADSASDTTSATRAIASQPRNPVEPARWLCEQTLSEHTAAVTAVAISPDNKLIVSGSADKSLCVWNANTGYRLHQFTGQSLWSTAGHGDRITGLAFHPNNRTVVSASEDGTVRAWGMNRYQQLATLAELDWGATAIALSASGDYIASASGNGVMMLWDWAQQNRPITVRKHRDRISALLFSGNDILISAGLDQIIRIWDLQDLPETGSLVLLNTLKPDHPITAIALTADGQTLITADSTGMLTSWDWLNGLCLQTIPAHTNAIYALAVDPVGRILASGGEDSRIHLWSLNTDVGDRLETLPCSWAVNSLGFSPDGRLLVSGLADATLQLWQRLL